MTRSSFVLSFLLTTLAGCPAEAPLPVDADAGPRLIDAPGSLDAPAALDAPMPVDAGTDAPRDCVPGESCRAAVNGCDLAETCTAEGTCPTDGLAPSTTICGAQRCTAGEALPEERCAGTSATCVASTPISCNGYVCVGATCGTSCTTDADCLATHFCQAGGLCAPRRIDGTACTGPTTGIECVSGACTASFTDGDADGRGTGPASHFCGTAPPAGRALLAGDCCDTELRAFPGQTTFFATASACGGFDFDCDGSATREDTSANACASSGACATGDRECLGDGEVGWSGSTPACGASASYVTSCSAMAACSPATCPGCTICRVTAMSRTQRCH